MYGEDRTNLQFFTDQATVFLSYPVNLKKVLSFKSANPQGGFVSVSLSVTHTMFKVEIIFELATLFKATKSSYLLKPFTGENKNRLGVMMQQTSDQ